VEKVKNDQNSLFTYVPLKIVEGVFYKTFEVVILVKDEWLIEQEKEPTISGFHSKRSPFSFIRSS
jgi:hypothetical protein